MWVPWGEDQRGSVETKSGKLRWTITNVSKLNCDKLCSNTFFTGWHPWRLCIYHKGSRAFKHLHGGRIFLECGDDAYLPVGWSRCANIKMSLINQVNAKKTITKTATRYQFYAGRSWGFFEFVIDSTLAVPNEYFLDDKCVIVAEVSVVDSGHDEDSIGNASPKQMPSSSNDEDQLMDFKGLCKIEKGFIHLLEEVCSKHPTLIEGHRKRKRTQKFNEWSFTALGRVLHFLKTKKVKDMNEEACNELQNLWEELETVRFDDLAWLEPYVHSALGMKNYMERALKVERLNDNVADLQSEIKALKAELNTAQKNLRLAKKDLIKAQEGFVKRNLDDELGYGMS